MFFLSLILFLICGLVLPWWGVGALAFVLGLLLPGGINRAYQVSAAAFVAWAELSFQANGHSQGMIAPKMAGLFHLPFSWLIYLVMATIAGIGAFFYFKSGVYLRSYVEAQDMTKEPIAVAGPQTARRTDGEGATDILNPRY